MKKAIYGFAILAMLSFLIAPVSQAVATANGSGDTQTVTTEFTRSSAGGDAPIIKVKWEMNKNYSDIDLTSPLDDDADEVGAQFMPPGAWGAEKNIWVCAIATDPDGVDDINAVYADIYYPTDIALGPGHEDDGCGQQHGLEIELLELDKDTGYNLFCNNIRNNQPELPTFNPDYNYDEICAQDGELMKETAKVYCKYTNLKWEDPAGDYKVVVHAADKAGLDSQPLVNYFEYLPLTAFEIDFDNVDYGNVKLNTHKIINGNLTWGDGIPSVRNIGNTRLNMTVSQDDMGLGQTTNGDTWWNVQWDARVGSEAQFKVYDPYQTVVLDDTLELSQMNEMDFSILVKKFPLVLSSKVCLGEF